MKAKSAAKYQERIYDQMSQLEADAIMMSVDKKPWKYASNFINRKARIARHVARLDSKIKKSN